MKHHCTCTILIDIPCFWFCKGWLAMERKKKVHNDTWFYFLDSSSCFFWCEYT